MIVNESPRDLASRLVPGGPVSLAAGTYAGGVLVEASVHVRGTSGVVIQGGEGGPVLLVDADELVVTMEDVVLTGGSGEAGGGLRLSGWSEVALHRVVVSENSATLSGGGSGGGIYAHRGTLRLVDCTLRQNHAPHGSAITLTGAARAEVRGGLIDGDILVTEGAELTLVGVRVTGRITARGTSTRAPTVVLRGTRPEGGIENDVNLPAAIVVEDA